MRSDHKKPIPYGRQSLDEDDIQAVVSVLRSSFWTTGPKVEEFEQRLMEVTSASHSCVVANGTAALHLLYTAVGIKRGDTVIVPAITFLSTANAAVLLGAEVVFADVDPDSGLLTAETLRAACVRNPTAKAAVAVHLNGQACDNYALLQVCNEFGMLLLEDAAHALGSCEPHQEGGERKVGECIHSSGACFSFHPVKTIAMGEGGAVTTQDPAIAEKITRLRTHGMVRDPSKFGVNSFDHRGRRKPWLYSMTEPGFNYRASDILCALGLAQINRLPDFLKERRRQVDIYDDAFSSMAKVMKPLKKNLNIKTGWHLYPVFCLQGENVRADLFHYLSENGIQPQVHYLPLPMQPYYQSAQGMLLFPNALKYYSQAVTLPLFVGMTPDEQGRVIEVVHRFFELS